MVAILLRQGILVTLLASLVGVVAGRTQITVRSLEKQYPVMYYWPADTVLSELPLSFLKENFRLPRTVTEAPHARVGFRWMHQPFDHIKLVCLEQESDLGKREILISLDDGYRQIDALVVGKTGRAFREFDRGRTPARSLAKTHLVTQYDWPIKNLRSNFEFIARDQDTSNPLVCDRQAFWTEHWKITQWGTFQKRSYLEELQRELPFQTYYPDSELSNTTPQGLIDGVKLEKEVPWPQGSRLKGARVWNYHWDVLIWKNVRLVYLVQGVRGGGSSSHVFLTLDSNYRLLHVLTIGGTGKELAAYLRRLAIPGSTIFYSEISARVHSPADATPYYITVHFGVPIESDNHDVNLGAYTPPPTLRYRVKDDGTFSLERGSRSTTPAPSGVLHVGSSRTRQRRN